MKKEKNEATIKPIDNKATDKKSDAKKPIDSKAAVENENISVSANNAEDGLEKVSSAVRNMSALIDDIVKKARKNFNETGKPDVDGKFLKESVGALKELYELLEESDGFGGSDNGVYIRFDDKTEEWSS